MVGVDGMDGMRRDGVGVWWVLLRGRLVGGGAIDDAAAVMGGPWVGGGRALNSLVIFEDRVGCPDQAENSWWPTCGSAGGVQGCGGCGCGDVCCGAAGGDACA